MAISISTAPCVASRLKQKTADYIMPTSKVTFLLSDLAGHFAILICSLLSNTKFKSYFQIQTNCMEI